MSRIGFILKLPGHEPAVRFGELVGLGDHAHAALGGGSYDDLRPKEAHELAPLDAKWLGHSDHKRVSLGCANHGKANSRVSASGLDDGLAGLELTGLFGCLDHRREPIGRFH